MFGGKASGKMARTLIWMPGVPVACWANVPSWRSVSTAWTHQTLACLIEKGREKRVHCGWMDQNPNLLETKSLGYPVVGVIKTLTSFVEGLSDNDALGEIRSQVADLERPWRVLFTVLEGKPQNLGLLNGEGGGV